jgi:hypothetical protein
MTSGLTRNHSQGIRKMLSKFVFLGLIFCLTSCTATLNLVNAGGQASDVVDDTLEQQAELNKPMSI